MRLAGLAVVALAGCAGPIWIRAVDARPSSPTMIRSSDVNLAEEGALGEFLVPTVAGEDASPVARSWAEFEAEVPAAGTYRLWGRLRFPGGPAESFVVTGLGGAAQALGGGRGAEGWHWDSLKADLPAGRVRFRVALGKSLATVYRPLAWLQAEPAFSPRLNLLCLSGDPAFVPTDEVARRALGTPEVRPLPPPAGGQPLPDWMRCPRWYTKDSWREELRHRRPGDIAALVRAAAANGAQAIRLSCYFGGDAYYRSRVTPAAPGLGDLDYLREALDEARPRGLKVVAYMNPNVLYAGHPLLDECAVREAGGGISRRPTYGQSIKGAHYACINRPRYRQFLRDVLAEIFSRYGPDGLYVDGLTPHVCFCPSCRDKYRQMFGADMPVEKLDRIPGRPGVWSEFGGDPEPVGDVENDPDAARLTQLLYQSLTEVIHEFRKTVKANKPDAVTLFHSHPKPAFEDAYDGTLTEVYRPRPWVHAAWRSGEMASYSNVFRVPVLFNVYPHEHFTAAEARYKALQGLAAGAYPNFWSTPGMKEVFGFMAREAGALDFAASRPARFLALPRDFKATPAQEAAPLPDGARYPTDRFLAPYVGAYSALMRAGLPVATLHRPRFHESLAGFRVLCLANVALMSDEQAEAVRRFVREGGGLVATHETSLYDEKGRRRQDFALADVFGAGFDRVLPAERREVRVEGDHPLARALSGDPPVHAELLVAVRPNTASAAVVHTYGAGRVVYLPGRLDAAQCQEPSPWTERLFLEAVRWVSKDEVPARVEAPFAVGLTLFEQPRRWIVHLVNHRRDSRFRSDAWEPVDPVILRLRLPDSRSVRSVRRLWADRPLSHRDEGGMTVIDVGRLDEYEAVAVEFR